MVLMNPQTAESNPQYIEANMKLATDITGIKHILHSGLFSQEVILQLHQKSAELDIFTD